MKAPLAVLAFAAGCTGETGTLAVSLTQAPGSTLLDSVQTLRVTITEPHQVRTVERSSDGFSLSLELDASGAASELEIEGLDADGALIANGASPLFPLGAVDARIVIYMAPPLSVGAAPEALEPARSELAVAALPYGAILAGGRLGSGAPSDAIEIYNAYDHSLVSGVPMPEPRAGLAMAVGTNNAAYLFGGFDESGAPTADLWRFDTTTPPAGSFGTFGVKDGFARGGEQLVAIGADHYLVTGTPAAELAALDGTLVARDDVTALPREGVSLTGNDGMPAAIFAGAEGVLRFRTGTFTTLDVPAAARADARTVVLPGGKVLVVCGTTEAVRIDAASGTAESFPNVPTRAKTGCAAAATSRYLIVAGGNDAGGLDGNVEIYDAATLAPVATVPLVVPRTGAVAFPLGTGQIAIAGGVDASGAPIATIELFTPPVE